MEDNQLEGHTIEGKKKIHKVLISRCWDLQEYVLTDGYKFDKYIDLFLENLEYNKKPKYHKQMRKEKEDTNIGKGSSSNQYSHHLRKC